jgi:hypothetical protein
MVGLRKSYLLQLLIFLVNSKLKTRRASAPNPFPRYQAMARRSKLYVIISAFEYVYKHISTHINTYQSLAWFYDSIQTMAIILQLAGKQ